MLALEKWEKIREKILKWNHFIWPIPIHCLLPTKYSRPNILFLYKRVVKLQMLCGVQRARKSSHGGDQMRALAAGKSNWPWWVDKNAKKMEKIKKKKLKRLFPLPSPLPQADAENAQTRIGKPQALPQWIATSLGQMKPTEPPNFF
jgi:hypothetical protein